MTRDADPKTVCIFEVTSPVVRILSAKLAFAISPLLAARYWDLPVPWD
jgi:hypothetical protein